MTVCERGQATSSLGAADDADDVPLNEASSRELFILSHMLVFFSGVFSFAGPDGDAGSGGASCGPPATDTADCAVPGLCDALAFDGDGSDGTGGTDESSTLLRFSPRARMDDVCRRVLSSPPSVLEGAGDSASGWVCDDPADPLLCGVGEGDLGGRFGSRGIGCDAGVERRGESLLSEESGSSDRPGGSAGEQGSRSLLSVVVVAITSAGFAVGDEPISAAEGVASRGRSPSAAMSRSTAW